MILIPFKGAHIDAMADFAGQAWMEPHFEGQDPRALADLGPAFSGAAGGQIIGCAGLIMAHDHRAIAWALFTSVASRHFLSIHRAAKAFLDAQTIRRIEAYVDCDFAAARRWVGRLGFAMEVERMRHFLPDGRDASCWVRFSECLSVHRKGSL